MLKQIWTQCFNVEPNKVNHQHVSIICKTFFLQHAIVICKNLVVGDHNPQVSQPLLKDDPTPLFLSTPIDKDTPIPQFL